jgi:hypothetical protein
MLIRYRRLPETKAPVGVSGRTRSWHRVRVSDHTGETGRMRAPSLSDEPFCERKIP